MDPPSWINEDFFLASLKKFFKDDSVKILIFSCKLALSTGENYTSHVYRVSIDFIRRNGSRKENKENISLIIKCMREDLVTLAQDMKFFPKEIDMFVTILPEMEKFNGSSNILSAKCISASLEPHPFIMVEDMCKLGYQVHKRQSGLDTEHALRILEKMAIFHASSHVMCKKNPSILKDMYKEGLYCEIDAIKAWLKLGFDMLAEITENSKDLEIYHKQLKKLTQNGIVDRSTASWTSKKNAFNVLNHGDSWVNNMMFCYDENGKLKDCIYVDFQLCVYGSPMVDLHYFVTTSLANDIIQDMDYFLDYYYVQLLMALNKMKCSLKDVPSFKEFMDDFRNRAFYGLVAMATVTPLVKSTGREDAGFMDLMTNGGEGSFRDHCYNNDAYRSAITLLLPIYEKLGVFSK